jgi:HlyD family secretion protein
LLIVLAFFASLGAFVRRFFGWFVVLVVVAGAIWGFLWWRERSQRPHYVTAVVTEGNVLRSVNTTGALNPLVTVQVGSYVSGTVKSISCDFNTEVVIGQNCATIDPVPFQLIVDQDRAQLETGNAQVIKDRAALEYSKISFERDTKLLAEGTVSQDTVDNDKSTYEQAKAQLGLDAANVDNKKAVLKAAEVNLSYTNILSPVVGTVITRSIDAGQTVAASLQSPTLFLIGKDLTKMQVDTNVSEADVGSLKEGQGVFFTVQAFPARTFHGLVAQIRRGPITVQNVVTYDVVVSVSNPDRALFPGMTADAHIVIDEHDNVLRVPLPALRFSPEGIARPRGGRGGRDQAGGAASESTSDIGSAPSEAPSSGPSGPSSTSGPMGASGASGPRHHFGHRGDGEGQPGGPSGPSGRAGGWRNRRDHGEAGGDQAASGSDHAGRQSGGSGREHRGGGRGSRDSHTGRIWVLENGKLRPVDVTTGLDDGALIEVSGGGLKAGDVIVVNAVNPNEERRAPGGGAGGPGGAGQGNANGIRQGGPRL